MDEEDNPIPDALVYFNLGSDDQNIKNTDPFGNVTFTADEGTYAVGCLMSGNQWLPAKKDVTLYIGSTSEVKITLIKKETIQGRFETKRMTLEEIEAAGIDTSDPDNQYYVRVLVYLTYKDIPYTEEALYNPVTEEGGKFEPFEFHTRPHPGQEGSEGPSVTDIIKVFPSIIPGDGDAESFSIAYLCIPIDVSTLKEFFNVDLYIVNNAGEDFSLLNNDIHLNVPEGLTLMKSNNSAPSADVNIPEIKGQTTESVSWVIRGDKVGDYYLSADYTGTLSGFNKTIKTKFEATDPLTVKGLSEMTLNVIIPSELHFGHLYYATVLENGSDIDVNKPKIDTPDILLRAKYYDSSKTDILNISNEDFNKLENLERDIDVMPPAYALAKYYRYHEIVPHEEARQKLVNYFYEFEQDETYGLNVQITTVDREYFKRTIGWHTVYSSPEGDSDREVRSFDFLAGEEIDDLVHSTDSSIYNPRLGHFLSVMARSIYNKENNFELVKKNYSELGFSRTASQFLGDENQVFAPYFIGEKTNTDGSKVVMITIQGSSNIFDLHNLAQWVLSNAGIGEAFFTDARHSGINNCSALVYNDLEHFMGGSMPKKNVTYVITGHSLGGGTGNLLAMRLYEEGVPQANVYDYNFACPNVAIGPGDISYWNKNGVHDNIINISNHWDTVPGIPGALCEIFSLTNLENTITFDEWSCWKKFGVSYWFKPEKWQNIPDAHDMTSYIDYMMKEYDTSHYDKAENRYRAVCVCCPVDVSVYDKDNNAIASVVNNTPDYCGFDFGEKAIIAVNGDKKLIYIMGNEDFTVRLKGTDNGFMELYFADSDLYEGGVDNVKMFKSVELTDGKEMLADAESIQTVEEVRLYTVNGKDEIKSEIFEDGRESSPNSIFTSIKDADITGIEDKVYTGKEVTQNISVILKGNELKENTDYEVSYKDNKDVGTATVYVKGIGSYIGTIKRTFEIKDAPTTTYAVTVNYGTGSGDYAEGASVTITANDPGTGKQFREWTGTDGLTFTEGNKTSSTAKFIMPAKAVTITATYEDKQSGGNSYTPSDGNSEPTAQNSSSPVTSETAPSLKVNAKISKPKAAKRAVTVKWKKASKKNQKKISGYQIQIATDREFTNIVKTATAGKKASSKKIKGLAKKTAYYVRVRTYRGGEIGKWSGTKKFKTK